MHPKDDASVYGQSILDVPSHGSEDAQVSYPHKNYIVDCVNSCQQHKNRG